MAGAVLVCSRVVSEGVAIIALIVVVEERPIVEVVGQANRRRGK